MTEAKCVQDNDARGLRNTRLHVLGALRQWSSRCAAPVVVLGGALCLVGCWNGSDGSGAEIELSHHVDKQHAGQTRARHTDWAWLISP